jgi:heme exporter protein A
VGFSARMVVTDLACTRGGQAVFEGLSFTVEPGEAIELRGANGAGKSSLLRILATLLPAARGSVQLDDPARDADEERTASLLYLGHLDAVKAAETVARQLGVWAALLGAPATRVREALKAVGLERLAERAGGTLSAGQRRRLALARLLLAPRALWLLDEPSAPLDAEGRAMLGALIAGHCAQGGLLIAAVHDPLPGVSARVLEIGR